jgi:hypothetical protein
MKKCPVCDLNWICDDEEKCELCGGKRKTKKLMQLNRDVDHFLGTNAYDIYVKCCKSFGWDINEACKFSSRTILYSKGAAHGLSPWFLAHSNYLNEMNSQKNWTNEIHGEYIDEYWTNVNNNYYYDNTIRIAFAKTDKGGYAFIGIYKPIDHKKENNNCYIKIYKRISNVYPFDEE